MLMIADNAALSLFNPYLSRDVVRSWILKSDECPLLLLKCLINPKQRYARLKSSSAVDNAPPNSSYPNPVLYEKGSGTFLFAESFAKGLLRTADEQRQDITVAVVSCLLIFLTEYGILSIVRQIVIWQRCCYQKVDNISCGIGWCFSIG